jgi:hypothetical protein
MSFKKINEKGELPGPRAVFISGYNEVSCQTVDTFLKNRGLTEIAVVPCREDVLDNTLGEILKDSSKAALFPPEKLPQVMLWSGITHQELDSILDGFKETELTRPIFATTTEHNLEFPLKTLLRHLLDDQKAMSRSN